MQRTEVNSSNVKEIGYDEKTGILEVLFGTGNVYQYFNVPEMVYKNLVLADSIGKFLNSSIKGKYRFRKLQ